MNYILIIGIFEAAFLILLLITKKNKLLPDYILGIILSLYALSISLSYIEIYNIQNNFPLPKIININWLVLFLHGPALWFYVKSLSTNRFHFKLIYLLHFAPFLFFLIWHYIHFISLQDFEKIYIAKNEIFKQQIFYKISIISIGISTITYNLWALSLIKKYRHKLNQYFSNTDNIDLNWLRILTIASLSIFLVNVAIFNLDLVFDLSSHKILTLTTYSFASVYVLLIGFFGLKQKNVFITISNDIQIKSENKDVVLEDESRFIDSLQLFMEEKRPFLDPKINLLKLSKLLQVRTDYLSEILNSRLHQTFFEFINRYRIKEFKKQCLSEDSKKFSILGIAYDCGFNSKASFYRAFKKFEGTSPSTYIQNVS